MRYSTAYRVSARQFNMMCAANVFDDDKVELLNGVLTMMTSGPGHDFAVAFLGELLRELLPGDLWSVREEKPVDLGRFWKPLPDLAVVRGTHRDFVNRTPNMGDVALIVEVSDTTYTNDAGIKLRRYEKSGLGVYWIVDLSRRRVEVREMGARGLSVPIYHGESDEIRVVFGGKDFGAISVRELLP